MVPSKAAGLDPYAVPDRTGTDADSSSAATKSRFGDLLPRCGERTWGQGSPHLSQGPRSVVTGDVFGLLDGVAAQQPTCTEDLDAQKATVGVEVDVESGFVSRDVGSAGDRDVAGADGLDEVDVGRVGFSIVGDSHTSIVPVLFSTRTDLSRCGRKRFGFPNSRPGGPAGAERTTDVATERAHCIY